MLRLKLLLMVLSVQVALVTHVYAQTLTTSNVQITWKVVNRFRLFKDADLFKQQENAWRQYGQHVNSRSASTADNDMFYYNSSVLGTEHVLNDRRIPFTNILRTKFDWRGWAASAYDRTCWNAKSRTHSACGDVGSYVSPQSQEIEIGLKQLVSGSIIAEYNCIWHVGDNEPITAPCDETVKSTLPYPAGATIAVNIEGESAISVDAQVKDLLIVGLGDSYASGEGNPDSPVTLDENSRSHSLYPARKSQDVGSDAVWMDDKCHRSLYSYQLRAALQIGLENPHGAVTFMGFSCSGAKVDQGILGPQAYVEYESTNDRKSGGSTLRHLGGRGNDGELFWAMRELCKVAPVWRDGTWICPDRQFHRPVDFVFLSIGGNDIGFANLVAWATLRDNASSVLAKFFGATVSAEQFAANLQTSLAPAYARLAKALEKSLPLKNGDIDFDPSRIVLTAYPDILADEKGDPCDGVDGSDKPEDAYASNQSLDRFSSWLVVTKNKLEAAHAQLTQLHETMGQLAEANGWTYAGRAYADQPFKGHGFCAQRKDITDDPAEVLILPCWGKAARPTQSCQAGIFGQGTGWRPYDPATQNYPYALRQRWVRTFNDAYMVMNQKVADRFGVIDEDASAANFSETTGAMHPNAEGHASMADAILIDLRPEIAKIFAEQK